MTFHSKVDAWIAVLLLSAVIVTLGAVAQAASRASGLALLGPAVLALVGVVLPLWVLLSTRYVVDEDHLSIRSGPFRWRVPLADITGVARTRSALSAPALSLDRVRIDYGAHRAVLVSPRDIEAFVRALAGDSD